VLPLYCLCTARNFPYRGFGDKINLDRIQRRYLPGRSVNALNAFYYNVS
jgi:hypothetical protein